MALTLFISEDKRDEFAETVWPFDSLPWSLTLRSRLCSCRDSCPVPEDDPMASTGSCFTCTGLNRPGAAACPFPASSATEGLSAAAASLAIIGEINPLLAEILSIMDAAGAGEEVAEGSPDPEMAWDEESVGADDVGLAPAEPAAIRLAELAGSGVETRLGMMGKKDPAVPGSAELESARAKGILLGRAWESRPEILVAGVMLLAGLLACEEASSAAEEGAAGTMRETEDC